MRAKFWTVLRSIFDRTWPTTVEDEAVNCHHNYVSPVSSHFGKDMSG